MLIKPAKLTAVLFFLFSFNLLNTDACEVIFKGGMVVEAEICWEANGKMLLHNHESL